MNRTLFVYIFNKQLKSILFVAFAVFSLISLFEFAEVSRKFPMTSWSEIFLVIKLSLLRGPVTFCEILHYIYFITATFSLWDLCRSHQVTIMKSAGKSPQQILFPFIAFSVVVASIWLFVMHPSGIYAENLYKRNTEHSDISSYEQNRDIWIDYGLDNKLIFIKSLNQNQIGNFYLFDQSKNEKIIAESGEISQNTVFLSNVTVLSQVGLKTYANLQLKDSISPKLVQLLSVSPLRQTIYNLYKIYQIQKQDHVNIRLYEFAFHKLLANGVSFILFALVAAIICFPINRYKTKTNLAIKVISFSLLLRFANSMMESFSYTGLIPVTLSAWAVTLVLVLISISALIWKEA
ncbi:MAG: LptF/LptG family permease [Alphaproteobacteria bacterium]|nr:LptF/LptG family permease [Alphaproteobacteria bacterium]